MSSQFDDLLGDFGDSGGSATIKAGGDSNGAEDSGLLVDFSVETEVTNGQSNGGVNFDMDSSSSANPLYDLSANDSQSQSSNPLYDFNVTTDTNTSSSTGNPLYDFTADEVTDDANQQQTSADANLLFDFTTETNTDTTTSTNSANPLYEFDALMTVDNDQSGAQNVDLLSGTNGAQTTDQYADLLGDFNSDQQQQQQQQQTYQNELEDVDSGIQQEYSGSGVNGGDTLHDLGPSDFTVTEEVTTYQDPPNADAKEPEQIDEEPERVVEEPEQIEVEPEQIEEEPEQIEEEPEQIDEEPERVVEEPERVVEEPEQIELEPEQIEEVARNEEDMGEVAGDAEALPDLIVREEGDEEVRDEVSHDVESQPQYAEMESEEKEEEKEVDMKRIEGDGEEEDEEQEHQSQESAEVPDSTGTEGAYHADRREEDLEQYCLHREEETSEVSDDRDQLETEEPEKVDVDQVEEVQEQISEDQVVDDQEAVSSQEYVPEVEQEDTTAPVENVEAEQEEEIVQDGRTVSKTTRREDRYSSGSGYDDSNQITSSAAENNFSSPNEPVMNTQPPAPQAAPRSQQSVTLYDDDDDDEEEGIYENEPEKRADVARETDTKEDENLPAAGTAQNIRAMFMASQVQSSTPRPKREISPPNPTQGGGEYVSEPRMHMEQYEGKPESGVFESQPVIADDIIRSGTQQEEAVPEQGFTKNVAARFKQLESENRVAATSGKREITPDRSGRVEYVSEPRGFVETYEGKSESGVFESQPTENPDIIRAGQDLVEELPERGTAKNLADRFRQISVENSSPSASRGKRELTPDTSGRVEYVSEPRGHIEKYEAKTESGVFENQPQEEPDVVKSEHAIEEYVPERGYTKNLTARFKELESNVKSPPKSPDRRKEFTPPREDAGNRQSGVYESTPQTNAEVVTSSELPEEVLPEVGTARNIAQRFRQLEAENKSPPSPKPKKEFTPPPQETGVYESQPQRFEADYNRPAESGILENQPMTREDVSRESERPKYAVELPERGMARNLVSRWKQMESESTKSPSPGGRQKEFTPPREEPRIAQQSRSPRTPKSPSADASMDNGSVHPSELPGQYQPQNEPSVFESTPQQNSEVTREADTDWSEGMPKKNTAKKMLARFQSIQAEASKESPRPESRKESESDNTTTTTTTTTTSDVDPAMQSARLKFEDPDKVGRSKSMRAAIQVEKCGACDKTVYAMERLEMNKRVYHRACFRCSQCKSVLTPKTFAINNDVIFCTTHYKQLFTRKGNYDEGFGRTQHKKRWNSNPNIAEAVKKEEADGNRNQQQVNS